MASSERVAQESAGTSTRKTKSPAGPAEVGIDSAEFRSDVAEFRFDSARRVAGSKFDFQPLLFHSRRIVEKRVDISNTHSIGERSHRFGFKRNEC